MSDREELDRLRKLKRLKELESKAGIQTAKPPAPTDSQPQTRSQEIDQLGQFLMPKIDRQAELGLRAVLEGTVDVAAPFANALSFLANQSLRILGLNPGNNQIVPEDTSGNVSRILTESGLATPETPSERLGSTLGRFTTGLYAGQPVSEGISNLFPKAPEGFVAPVRRAVDPNAKVLEENGIRLNKGQASGDTLGKRLARKYRDNPATANAQVEFEKKQAEDYTRAVLRRIGVDSDRASQGVMDEAAQRIGSIFDEVGASGAKFTPKLSTKLNDIGEDIQRTVISSERGILKKIMSDIHNSVTDGTINGDQFNRIRSQLGEVSKKYPSLKDSADEINNALLQALEDTNPGQRELLKNASTQWRTLKLIEKSIGYDELISPKKLNSSIFTKNNLAMTVRGKGGDQELVKLVKAARDVIPDKLADSGTPGGMQLQDFTKAGLLKNAMNVGPKIGQYFYLRQPAESIPYAPSTLRGPAILSAGGQFSREQ